MTDSALSIFAYPVDGWFLLSYGLVGIGALIGIGCGVIGGGVGMGFLLSSVADFLVGENTNEHESIKAWKKDVEKKVNFTVFACFVGMVIGIGIMFLGTSIGYAHVW